MNPTMDNKTRALIVVSIAFIIVVIVLIFASRKIDSLNTLVDQKESVIAEKNAIITYERTDKGKIKAQKEAAELRSKDLEKAYPEIYKFIKDELDINTKNVKAFVRNEFIARGTGTGSVVTNNYYDSSTNTSFDSLKYVAGDGYFSFNVNFELRFKNNKFSYTQSPYHHQYIDTASTVIHGKKKWFLGSEKLYSTTTFANPNAKITGTTNILVNNYRDKRFSISISAGYGLVKVKDEVHAGWFIGPTASYSLFKF